MLLTHIAMSHELQRGTKRSAVHELPVTQQMRFETAVDTPSYQQQQQWQDPPDVPSDLEHTVCILGCGFGEGPTHGPTRAPRGRAAGI